MDAQRWLVRVMVLAALGCWGGLGLSPAHGQNVVMPESYWLPMNAAEHGTKIDALFTLIFVVTSVVGAAVFGVLIYILIKYRYQEGRKVVFIHGHHKLEMIWTITPTVILAIMGILSIRVWADIRMARPDFGEEVTEVEVLAQRFQWDIRYPGEDGKFNTDDDIGTFTKDLEPDKYEIISEIVVPVNRPVRIHLMSRDVLHSLFIPNMRQKLDAVPGLRGQLMFTPTTVGRYEILCAELCGDQHYAMNGVLVVLSQADYDVWIEERYEEIREIIGYWDDDDDWDDEEEDMEEDEAEEEDADEPDDAEAAAEPDDDVADTTEGVALITDETPSDAVVGHVRLDGGPVDRRALRPGADPFCQKAAEANPILDETIVAGPDGSLRNVFVKVIRGLPSGRTWEIPDTPVVLDQRGCRYVPHVFGVMAGQKLEIRNSDNTNHNVHGLPKANSPFNFGQPRAGMVQEMKLDQPENFQIKCDVHAWMNTWCHVVDHPFFAVTDEKGVFMIQGLPAGDYELEYWHESLGTQTANVKLTAGSAAEAPAALFSESRRPRRR